jgi:molecular chaperone HscA
MLLATQSALNADGDLLSADERAQIEQLMQRLRQAVLTEQDAQNLENATMDLAKGTEAFAAERMNHSIQKALSGQNIQAL